MSPTPHPDRRDFERLDAMDRPERERLLDHAAACARCRRELAADDPGRAFALLGRFDPPADRLDELSARVAAAIDSTERRDPSRPPARVWGALAAAVLLAGAIGWVLGLRPTPPSPLPRDDRPLAGTAVAPEPLRVSGPSGGAQVVEMTVGDARVVMIFDDDLDL